MKQTFDCPLQRRKGTTLLREFFPIKRLSARFQRDPDSEEAASRNERQILSLMWKVPAITRASIASQMDISPQSVHRILSGLHERGLIAFGSLEPPVSKGKHSPQLILNPRFGCAVGISINTDDVGVSLMDFGGNFLTRHFRTRPDSTIEETLDLVEREISGLLTQCRFQREAIFGMGVAITGFLVDGTRYNPPEPLAHWSTVHLAPLFSERFDCAVWTENGANASAVYEQMFGLGREVDDFVYIALNYGLGAGVVVGGDLLRGHFGNAGELSGMFTSSEWHHRPALRSLIAVLQKNGIDVSSVSQLSHDFDPDWPGVLEWLDMVTPHQNRLYNVLAATFDPEVVVIGGEIPPALGLELIRRTESYGGQRHGVSRRMPRLELAKAGGDAAAIGAASLPLKKLFF